MRKSLLVDSRNDWECLAFGRSNLPNLKTVSLARELRSAHSYLKACRIYQRYGFAEASKYLHVLRIQFSPLDFSSNEEATRLARSKVAFLRVMGRLASEDRLCLPAATSLTAGLIALGIQAQLVVGKCEDLRTSLFDFHAWTEVSGTPLSESPLSQKCYTSLLKWPDWKTLPHSFNQNTSSSYEPIQGIEVK